MRYVVVQCNRKPYTVVGTVRADSLGHAAQIAGALWGSYWVRVWSGATPAERAEALRQDTRANVLAQARLLGLLD